MATRTLGDIKQNISKHYFKIVNFLIFQGVWMLCVIGQHRFIGLALGLIALHFALSPSRLVDAKTMIVIAIIGIALDYILMITGLFQFDGGGFPLWLAVLWLAFPLSLSHSLIWLAKTSLPLQMLLGSVGGASSYIGGYFLGAVDFGLPLMVSSAVLFVVWAAATPLYCYILRTFRKDATQ